jgi:hypothetical protein
MSNEPKGDLLVGMKAICRHLHGISESTVLKWHRELDLPIRKSDKNGNAGIWIGSRKKLDDWAAQYVAGGVA